MGNVITYLKWRGDLNFQERPFGEVDNMVLAMLSYVDMSGIIPEHGMLTLEQAAEVYFKNGKQHRKSLKDECEELFYEMAHVRRFKNALLSDYQEILDETTQFAAVQVHLDDGTKYIAFRGTDDSIAGWREDFAISFQVTSAQTQAVCYLENCMTEDGCIYRVGGHSKGGNLAMYAAMMCSRQKQKNILEIYNNDGPGICPEMLLEEGFGNIKGRIRRYLPEFSIIGRLFEADVMTYMVGSCADGVLQHDGMTWEVEGDHFVYRTVIPGKCQAYNRIFDAWIEDASVEQRESFTKDFFDALGADGAKTIGELQAGGLDGYGAILVALAESETRTKIVIGKLVGAALEYIRHIDLKEILRSKQGIRGLLWMLVGILFMLFPSLAIQGIGGTLAFAGFIWSGRKIMNLAFDVALERDRKRRKLLVYMATLSLMVVLMCNYKAVMISVNLAIGVMLILFAFSKTRDFFRGTKRKKAMRIFLMAESVLCFMLGVVSLVTPGRIFSEKILTVGSFFILYGMGKIAMEMFKESRMKMNKDGIG